MKIETSSLNGVSSLKVYDQVMSLQDTAEFKKALHASCITSPSVNVYFENCLILPSAVIGALLQKKEIDKIAVKVMVKHKELRDSLSRLGLSDILNLTVY